MWCIHRCTFDPPETIIMPWDVEVYTDAVFSRKGGGYVYRSEEVDSLTFETYEEAIYHYMLYLCKMQTMHIQKANEYRDKYIALLDQIKI